MNLDLYDHKALFGVLEKELKGLPPLHRVAFAASICERMLPNYNAFSREEDWGNTAALRTALNEVWQILQGKAVEPAKIYQLMENCEMAMPHTENFIVSEYTEEALAAAIAVYETLSAVLEPTPDYTIVAAKQAVLTLEGFITYQKETANPDWGVEKSLQEQRQEVANHPFVVREMVKQSEDLQRLKDVKALNWEFLEWLRTSSYNDGKSMIDVS